MRAVGVDLGGHNVVAGLVDGDVILTRLEEATESSREPGAVVAQVARMARTLGAGVDVPSGVCIPGGVDAVRECAMMVANFAGWNGLPIRRMFEDAIGAPTVIENDANAYALGEGFAGVAKGIKDYIVLTLGTGIGGGVIVGGHLLRGAHGMAGELGHIVLGRDELCGPGCRGHGHFEALCGADALERKAKIMGLGDCPSLKELWERRTEDSVAPLWESALDTFARGIASLVHVFDPELVVIGGGLRKGEGFIEAVEDRLPYYLSEPFKKTVKIRPSVLNTDAPVFGAVALARAEMKKRGKR